MTEAAKLDVRWNYDVAHVTCSGCKDLQDRLPRQIVCHGAVMQHAQMADGVAGRVIDRVRDPLALIKIAVERQK